MANSSKNTQRRGARNVGTEYQFKVLSYIAAYLSDVKGNVRDFHIYTNLEDVALFDDLIIKVWFENQPHPYLYFGQIKHKNKPPYIFHSSKHQLIEYKDAMEFFLKERSNKELFKDVPEENITFLFYVNTSVGKTKLENDNSSISYEARELIDINEDTSIIPKKDKNGIYNFFADDSEFDDFFNKFHLYANNSNNDKIRDDLIAIFPSGISVEMAAAIFKYVDDFFRSRRIKPLDKYTFQTELLKIRLSKFIIPASRIVNIQKNCAKIWNEITLNHNLTLIDKVNDIEQSLFGCFKQRINNLHECDINWNECIDEDRKLPQDIMEKINKYSQYSLDKADTIDSLLLLMWQKNDLPLILKTDSNISILIKYQHLNKKFIIIDDPKRFQGIPISPSIFNNIANIKTLDLRENLLKTILISLQGRKQTTLFDVINNNQDAMKLMSCADILCLIRKYDENESDINIQIKKVYLPENHQETDLILPVIGCRLDVKEKDYIGRFLRKQTLKQTLFDGQNRQICFFCGDVSNLTTDVKILQPKIAEIESELDRELKTATSAFIDIKSENVEKFWPKYSKHYQLFYIKITKNRLELIKTENCTNLNEYVTYSDKLFHEKDFFDKTASKVTVISGEPGLGKSSLLHSLSTRCDEKNYVLFCNLSDYNNELGNMEEEFYENPLDFIFERSEKSNFYRFMRSIYENHKETGRLTIFIDSFDEVLTHFEDQVLALLKKVIDTKVRIIIASRSIADTLLINNLNLQPVKLDKLKTDDFQEYLNVNNLTIIGMKEIPQKFLENPLYLKFLCDLNYEESLDFKHLDILDLYRKVIEKKIKRYYEKHNKSYNPKNKIMTEKVLEIHRLMALVVIFGDDIIAIYGIIKKYEEIVEKFQHKKIQLGIVKYFSNNHPIFIHYTFAEYLAMEWIYQNLTKKESAQSLYKMIADGTDKNLRFLLDSMLSKNLKLHNAIIKEDLILIDELCNGNQANFGEVDSCGRNALHLAATYCFYDDVNYKILNQIVHHMMKNKCDFNTEDKYTKRKWVDYCNRIIHQDFTSTTRESLMFDALNYDHLDLVLILLNQNPSLLENYLDDIVKKTINLGRLDITYDVLKLENGGDRAFMRFDTACCNHNEITKENLRKFVRLEVNYDLTSLHLACMFGSVEMIRNLLNAGADKFARDELGNTPVHYAAMIGLVDVLEVLIDNSPRTNVKDKYGNTALHLACRFSRLDAVRLLLDRGAQINDMNTGDATPLQIASERNSLDILEILLEFHVNLTQKGTAGNTALHIACEKGNLEVVKWFTQNSDEVNSIKNKDGLTPFEVACLKENFEVVKHFLDKNNEKFGSLLCYLIYNQKIGILRHLLERKLLKRNDLEYMLENGQTLLHIAVRRECFEILKLLLDEGININIDNNGYTPLHFYSNEDVAKYFMEKTPIMKDLANDSANIRIMLQTDFQNSRVSSKISHRESTINNNQKLQDVNILKYILEHCVHLPLILNTRCAPACVLHLKVSSDSSTFFERFSTKNSNNTKNQQFTDTNVTINQLNSTKIITITAKTFSITCIEGKYEFIEKLLEQSMVQIDEIYFTKSVLFTFVTNNLLEPLSFLYNENFINKHDLEYTDEQGNTLLHVATLNGHTEIMKFLLDANVAVNSQNDKGCTPLHFAKKAEDVKLLLERCDSLYVNVKTKDNRSPLFMASLQNRKDVMRELLTVDNEVSCKDRFSWTALHHAIRQGYESVANLLLDNGADINETTDYGETVLHICVARFISDTFVKRLLERGADVKIQDIRGYTALDLRAQMITDGTHLNEDPIAKVLMEFGAELNSIHYSKCRRKVYANHRC